MPFALRGIHAVGERGADILERAEFFRELAVGEGARLVRDDDLPRNILRHKAAENENSDTLYGVNAAKGDKQVTLGDHVVGSRDEHGGLRASAARQTCRKPQDRRGPSGIAGTACAQIRFSRFWC